MRKLCFFSVLILLSTSFQGVLYGAVEDSKDKSLIVKDGQLLSHLFRVFVRDTTITTEMDPRLSLVLRATPNNITQSTENRKSRYPWKPVYVLPNQQVTEAIGGTQQVLSGTLLMFDLAGFDMEWWQAVQRATPILNWEETQDSGDPIQHTFTTEQPIYLGNLTAAVGWAVFLVIVMILITMYLSRSQGGSLGVLRNNEGKFSLSRVQMSAWTLAIGAMVCVFGLIHLKVPEIPMTLVALMGLSLVTSGISAHQGEKKRKTKKADPKPRSGSLSAQLSQLIADSETGQISLPRVQMLFWTMLNVSLFLVKSTLDGVLWEVPWEMVGLMGMSQAGYLTPKMVGGQSAGPQPDPSKGGGEVTLAAPSAK